MLANGATLGYRKHTDGENSAAYTDLPGLKEIPEVGVELDKEENTCLTDPHKMYEEGIGDLPDMKYKWKYDNSKAGSPYRLMRDAADKKEMKMKNSEIVTFLNTCTDLRQKRLPVRLAYAIKKNMAAVQEAATAYMEEREELIARYAKKDKKGEYLVKDNCYVFENKDEFEKDMSELLAIETAVKIHTVSIDTVEKCDDDPKYDPLTMEELDVIEFMITMITE